MAYLSEQEFKHFSPIQLQNAALFCEILPNLFIPICTEHYVRSEVVGKLGTLCDFCQQHQTLLAFLDKLGRIQQSNFLSVHKIP